MNELVCTEAQAEDLSRQLSTAKGFSFEEQKQAINDLRLLVAAEEAKVLVRDLNDLQHQLVHLTDYAPDTGVRSPYGIVIEPSRWSAGLFLLRSGTLLRVLLSLDEEGRFEDIRAICPYDAVEKFGLDQIRYGLAALFIRKFMELEEKRDVLRKQLAKARDAQARQERR